MTTDNKELGIFLKKKRSTISPQQYGITVQRKRRVSGLTREEIADLSGVSTDWYTRIEQGQNVNPSVDVLLSLSRVLHLNENEKKYLFHLSDKKLPLKDPVPLSISATLQQFLDSQNPNIAYVTDQRMSIVAWNTATKQVYGNYDLMDEKQRNSIWRSFHDPYMEKILDHWEGHSKLRVEQLRANFNYLKEDLFIQEIITELDQNNSLFHKWWNDHGIMGTPEGQKLLHHPNVGDLYLSYISFKSSETKDLTITIQMPVDEQTKLRLELLYEKNLAK